MSKKIEVPPELQHLIEKRDQPDRRTGERRQGPAGESSPHDENPAPISADPATDSSKPNRRRSRDRRATKRR